MHKIILTTSYLGSPQPEKMLMLQLNYRYEYLMFAVKQAMIAMGCIMGMVQ